MIHYQVLNDMDVSTVLQEPLPSDKQGCFVCESLRFHIIDPSIYSLIEFYNRLFRRRNHPMVWQEYVRFVFPSILAMADVFYDLRKAKMLHRIRKVKLFHRDGLYYKCRSRFFLTSIIWPFNVLDEYKDLQLDHLEYETQTGFLSYAFFRPQDNEVGRWVSSILASPGWRRLSILAHDDYFSSEVGDQLIEIFERQRSLQTVNPCTFDLPGTPLLLDGDRIVGLLYPHLSPPPPPHCTPSELRNATPSWLGGAPVKPVIIAEREHYCAPVPYTVSEGDVFLWYKGQQSTWKEYRRVNGQVRRGILLCMRNDATHAYLSERPQSLRCLIYSRFC